MDYRSSHPVDKRYSVVNNEEYLYDIVNIGNETIVFMEQISTGKKERVIGRNETDAISKAFEKFN